MGLVTLSGVETYEQLTVSDSAVGITSSILVHPESNAPALAVAFQCTDGSIRWRCDGTSPTSTTGFLSSAKLGSGPVVIHGMSTINALEMITDADATGNATVEVFGMF